MIKIVMLVLTVVLSALVAVLGFLPYYDSDDVYARIYVAIAVNIAINILVLGVVIHGLT